MAIALTRAAGMEDPSKRAMYGAIGSAIGTGTGVVTALLFMLFVYNVNRKTIKKKVEYDLHDDMDIADIAKLLTSIMLPFIFSTCIYNLSTVLNSTLFNRILINVKGLDESIVAAQYGIFNRKAMNITNLPIALASAAAAALIPEVSTSFSRGDKKEAEELVSRVIRVILMIAIPSAVGLFALAKPVMMILYPAKASLDEASLLLTILAVTVVFYSLSTLTNAVLQGVGRVMAPVINAIIALAVQTLVLVLLLKYTDLGDIALCIVTILYSFMMCVLNQLSLKKKLDYHIDIMKTYLLPSLSAVVMGAVAFGVDKLFAFLLGLVLPSEYFTNIISTMIAVFVAIFVYFFVLIRTGGATEEDIKRFPKGASIASLLRKLHIL
jgi:stage V sporulation protein B